MTATVEDLYGPPLVLGGPGVMPLLPCQGGPTQRCKWGQHDRCCHRIGGPAERGITMPGDYLVFRDGGTVSNPDGSPLPILPEHVYRCPCSCHAVLTLF